MIPYATVVGSQVTVASKREMPVVDWMRGLDGPVRFPRPARRNSTDVLPSPVYQSVVVPLSDCSALRAQMIRLVTFDALHTLITPRKPLHVQYSEVFSPYLGTLPPDSIARSLKLGVLFFYTFHMATVRLRQTRGSDAATASREAVVSCGCDSVVERGHFPDGAGRGRGPTSG